MPKRLVTSYHINLYENARIHEQMLNNQTQTRKHIPTTTNCHYYNSLVYIGLYIKLPYEMVKVSLSIESGLD